MALVFPTSPTDGTLYTNGQSTWEYDTTTKSWLSVNYPTYDLAGGAPGALTASQVVLRCAIARSMAFPVNFSGSYWSAGTAPTATATFTVAVNGTSIGTISFAASVTTATFTTVSTGTTTIAADSVLTITGPATADATLANAVGTLVGVLV